MANREENLKKINEKLEQLTDEQLEDIAGGFYIRGEMNPPFKEIVIIPTNNEPKKNIRYDDAVRT